jgi:hypothetical protein
MIAAIAGARLVLPPTHMLSAHRRPADCAALVEWLEASAPVLDALIVGCETLGYGGLIASRISDEPAGAILARLDALRAIRRRHPRLPIYGFSVITRVSNADDAIEEPDYWASYGARLYQLSQLLDRRGKGQDVAGTIAELERAIPRAHRDDFLRRRLRNHAVSAATMHLLAEGAFDLLVLSSDDTSPDGLPSREKRWLAGWAELLGLGDDRLLMYAGADEVGCALLARLLNTRAGTAPSFAAAYAPPAAAEHVAPYEDGPVRVTVERQVRAVGGRLADEPGATWLAVAAPVARRGEWDPALAERELASRLPDLRALAGECARRQSLGQPVLVADVAYPNGADPGLFELLRQRINLPALAAYGAWNTAGNTIGTALAQACAARLADSPTQRAAQEQFLLHRIVEDWGYQRIVRAELRERMRAAHGTPEPPLGQISEICRWVELRLGELIEQLPGFDRRWRIAPGSVSLPWSRTFEVDFALEPAAAPAKFVSPSPGTRL